MKNAEEILKKDSFAHWSGKLNANNLLMFTFRMSWNILESNLDQLGPLWIMLLPFCPVCRWCLNFPKIGQADNFSASVALFKDTHNGSQDFSRLCEASEVHNEIWQMLLVTHSSQEIGGWMCRRRRKKKAFFFFLDAFAWFFGDNDEEGSSLYWLHQRFLATDLKEQLFLEKNHLAMMMTPTGNSYLSKVIPLHVTGHVTRPVIITQPYWTKICITD